MALRARGVLALSASLGLASSCVPPSRHADNRYAQPPPQRPYGYPYPYTQQPTAPPPAATVAPLPPPPVTASAPPAYRRPPIIKVVTTAKPPPPAPPPTTPGCGEVDVDGVKVPLDCLTKDYAKLENASQGVQRQALAASTTAPPDYVDHRRDGLEGPIRHQRTVGAGAAFALAGAMDQSLIRNGAGFSPVSAMELWMRAPRPNWGRVATASLGKNLTSEATLPYDEARACAFAADDANRLCTAPKKNETPTDADFAKADAAPFAKLTEIVEIDGTNVDGLRATLARNQDVLAVLRVDPDAWRAVVKSSDQEPLVPDYVGTGGVQSVTLVGYFKQESAWFFLVKNSWGTSWGNGGYAWIAETTLKKNVIEAYVVQAVLANGAPSGSVPSTCAPGTVPDAVTKQCAPPCPDNSPRTSGVCPDAAKSNCPAGFTNVTGTCVPSAPDRSGTDPSLGIAYACGAAGCTYTWKRGMLGCTSDACSISCPVPKYFIAVNTQKKTVACTE